MGVYFRCKFFCIYCIFFIDLRLSFLFLSICALNEIGLNYWIAKKMFFSPEVVTVLRHDDKGALVSIVPKNKLMQLIRNERSNFKILIKPLLGDLHNVRIEAVSSQQPSGSLPRGVSVETHEIVFIPREEERFIEFSLMANSEAPDHGILILSIYAKNHGDIVLGRVTARFELIEGGADPST